MTISNTFPLKYWVCIRDLHGNEKYIHSQPSLQILFPSPSSFHYIPTITTRNKFHHHPSPLRWFPSQSVQTKPLSLTASEKFMFQSMQEQKAVNRVWAEMTASVTKRPSSSWKWPLWWHTTGRTPAATWDRLLQVSACADQYVGIFINLSCETSTKLILCLSLSA